MSLTLQEVYKGISMSGTFQLPAAEWIKEDLNRLGIEAAIIQYDTCRFSIVFSNDEDKNLYKLLGFFKPDDLMLNFIIQV